MSDLLIVLAILVLIGLNEFAYTAWKSRKK
jgi:hypothetical protein